MGTSGRKQGRGKRREPGWRIKEGARGQERDFTFTTGHVVGHEGGWTRLTYKSIV